MDADRFDALTAAGAANRRVLVRSLVAAAVAALLGRARVAAVDVTCGAPGAPCRKASDCCATGCKKKQGQKKGRCAPCSNDRMFCGDTCCPRFGLGFDCADGRGVCLGCPVGSLPCGDTCCPPELCVAGACVCPDGRELCAGAVTGVQCCLAGDACGRTLGCQAETCRLEISLCGEASGGPITVCGGTATKPCFCAVALPDGFGCVPLKELSTVCPDDPECDSDDDCAPGEVCLDRGARPGCGPGCGPAPFGVCETRCQS